MVRALKEAFSQLEPLKKYIGGGGKGRNGETGVVGW